MMLNTKYLLMNFFIQTQILYLIKFYLCNNIKIKLYIGIKIYIILIIYILTLLQLIFIKIHIYLRIKLLKIIFY